MGTVGGWTSGVVGRMWDLVTLLMLSRLGLKDRVTLVLCSSVRARVALLSWMSRGQCETSPRLIGMGFAPRNHDSGRSVAVAENMGVCKNRRKIEGNGNAMLFDEGKMVAQFGLKTPLAFHAAARSQTLASRDVSSFFLSVIGLS